MEIVDFVSNMEDENEENEKSLKPKRNPWPALNLTPTSSHIYHALIEVEAIKVMDCSSLLDCSLILSEYYNAEIKKGGGTEEEGTAPRGREDDLK